MSGADREEEPGQRCRPAVRSGVRGVRVARSGAVAVSTGSGWSTSWSPSGAERVTSSFPAKRTVRSHEWQLLRREIHRHTGAGPATELAGLIAETDGSGQAMLTVQLSWERLSPAVQRLLRGGGEEVRDHETPTPGGGSSAGG